MKQRIFRMVCLISICSSLLTACAAGNFPKFKYYDSLCVSINDRTFELTEGYVLNQSHSYDIVPAEGGYDIIFHFVEKER